MNTRCAFTHLAGNFNPFPAGWGDGGGGLLKQPLIQNCCGIWGFDDTSKGLFLIIGIGPGLKCLLKLVVCGQSMHLQKFVRVVKQLERLFLNCFFFILIEFERFLGAKPLWPLQIASVDQLST